jgi:hypothetical protein
MRTPNNGHTEPDFRVDRTVTVFTFVFEGYWAWQSVTQLPETADRHQRDWHEGCDRSRHRVNRSAHLLIPPLRRIKAASGSELGLYSIAYRSTRDHLERVRLSTFTRSEVQRMTAANGSS